MQKLQSIILLLKIPHKPLLLSWSIKKKKRRKNRCSFHNITIVWPLLEYFHNKQLRPVDTKENYQLYFNSWYPSVTKIEDKEFEVTFVSNTKLKYLFIRGAWWRLFIYFLCI